MMPDRKKVIKGISQCWMPRDSEEIETQCVDCPYYYPDGTLDDCMAELRADAIELLKEQEPVKPIPPTDETEMWRCGNCHHQIFRCTYQRYCERCGRAVKWND